MSVCLHLKAHSPGILGHRHRRAAHHRQASTERRGECKRLVRTERLDGDRKDVARVDLARDIIERQRELRPETARICPHVAATVGQNRVGAPRPAHADTATASVADRGFAEQQDRRRRSSQTGETIAQCFGRLETGVEQNLRASPIVLGQRGPCPDSAVMQRHRDIVAEIHAVRGLVVIPADRATGRGDRRPCLHDRRGLRIANNQAAGRAATSMPIRAARASWSTKARASRSSTPPPRRNLPTRSTNARHWTSSGRSFGRGKTAPSGRRSSPARARRGNAI